MQNLRNLERSYVNLIADFIYSFKKVFELYLKSIQSNSQCLSPPVYCYPSSMYTTLCPEFQTFVQKLLAIFAFYIRKNIIEKFTIILVLIISNQKITFKKKLNHISLIYDGKNVS